MARFFVYVDFRLDTGEPCYVGIGNQGRVDDLKPGSRNQHWTRVLLKCGIRREVVLGSYDWAFVCEQERALIWYYQTRNYHGGCNFTDGGEGTVGYNHTEAARRKLRFLRSVEQRKRMSRSHQGAELSLESRRKIREAKIGRTRRPLTPQEKLILSLAQKKRYATLRGQNV